MRQSYFNTIVLVAAGLLGLSASGQSAHAAFTLYFQQSGGNVVATGSGTINTAALTVLSTVNYYSEMDPSLAFAILGPPGPTGVADTVYTGTSGPSSFGSIDSIDPASSGSGPTAGVVGFADRVAVPVGYVSGAPLSDSATWTGATFSSLGITPGNYTWTWGSGATADSFTVTTNAAVPEPASLSLLGLGGLALLRRRSRRAVGL